MPRERVLLCLTTGNREQQERRAALEAGGFEVLTAVSAAEALRMLPRRHFDALVVDDPGYLEVEPFVRQLRRMARNLPVVVLAGAHQTAGRALLRAAAVVAPEDPAALRSALDALNQPRRLAA